MIWNYIKNFAYKKIVLAIKYLMKTAKSNTKKG